MKTLAERFWERVNVGSPDDCWLWKASVSAGYGNLRIGNGKRMGAHRVSYEIHKGAIPYGEFVLHSCDNPRCVNPKHLFAGTDSDNMRDMTIKGRNSKAKLTARQAEEIRSIKGTCRRLAKEYGVSPSTINKIKTGQSWPQTNG